MLSPVRKLSDQWCQNVLMIVLVTFFYLVVIGASKDDYWAKRGAFIKKEESKIIGADLVLNEMEEVVNQILMEKKLREYDEGFADPKTFIPANHIFDTLHLIEESEVFKFIKRLPKGSLLHGHDTALASGEYLYNLTYKPDLYACYEGKTIKLHFFHEPITDDTCKWQPIDVMRQDNETFDTDLKLQLTLVTPDHKTTHTDINTVWSLFTNIFMLVDPLICYKPVFTEYFYQALQELYDDNVMYLEFRSTLPEVYDLEGNVYDSIQVAGLYKQTLDLFMSTHPDFLGAKFIYAPVRKVDNKTMTAYVDIATQLVEKYPTFIAGFDLVGQEDLGYPLIDFLDQLMNIGEGIPFFFHAGETNWYGTTTDFNLVDAVLLGTKRIGHGYAVLKHPDVAAKVKQDKIALEISPISNQVLMLVKDLRNHPGNYLIAGGYPVVVTNDDPSFWGTKALSYDWYMAYMGMTSRNTDLRFLKQLAINSIEYSMIDDKTKALEFWEQQWNNFLHEVLKNGLDSHINPTVLVHH